MADTINVTVSTATAYTVTINDTGTRKETYVGDSFTGTGAQTAFTLSQTPRSTSELVFLNGIPQTRTTDYSISGTTLTFVTAPKLNYKVYAYYVKN